MRAIYSNPANEILYPTPTYPFKHTLRDCHRFDFLPICKERYPPEKPIIKGTPRPTYVSCNPNTAIPTRFYSSLTIYILHKFIQLGKLGYSAQAISLAARFSPHANPVASAIHSFFSFQCGIGTTSIARRGIPGPLKLLHRKVKCSTPARDGKRSFIASALFCHGGIRNVCFIILSFLFSFLVIDGVDMGIHSS